MRHQGVCNRHNDVITRFYISLLHPKNSDHNILFALPYIEVPEPYITHPHKISCWPFGINHWMKADIKPKNKVRPISTVYCLSHIFLKLLGFLNSKNIAPHFIMWHHICSSSAKLWIIAFVGSSYSVLTSLETTCHKWLNCLFVQVSYWAGASLTQPYGKNYHLESLSLFPALTPIQNESDAWKQW